MAYKYNPAFLTDQDSIRNFVVRNKDLELVSGIVLENTLASANRHVLVVGPRGSGKSTLARRLVAEAKTDPKLSAAWHPVVLGEESYTITSAGEFWLECVFHLAEQSERRDLDESYRRIQGETDDARLRELALGVLVSFATQINKRILLVVENFNMIMEDQMDSQEGWAIRHTLHNVPEVMLFATATRKFDQIENVDKALFEQFKIHELRPLSLTDVTTLWTALTQEPVVSRKTRPIQILTGGSPRLIAILAEFAVGHSFTNLMLRLTSLIDQYTDYFKSQLDSLATAERKVFVSVLQKWDPATTREVSEEARMPINPTSAQLTRLRSRGAVQRRLIGGTQYWEASERLFNLYYLMRRRGAPSSRVYALVKFMTIYYERDQLYERATDLAKECGTLDPTLRQDHYMALAQIMDRFDADRRAQLLTLTPPDFARRFGDGTLLVASKGSKRPNFAALRKKLSDLINSGNVAQATQLLESGKYSVAEYAALWAFVGVANWFVDKDFEKSQTLLKRAQELDSHLPMSWYFLGLVLNSRKEYNEAVSAFKEAIARGMNDAEAWVSIGESYEELSELGLAEDAFRTATKTEESSPKAWLSLGSFLFNNNKDPEEAELALRSALRLNPDDVDCLGTLGTVLLQTRPRTPEAEAMFREVLKREPKEGRAWAFLIRSLAAAGRPPKEVETEFASAMSTVGVKGTWRVSSAYAHYLDTIHEHDRAEKILQEATISFPDVGPIWFELARHLAFQTKKSHEALEAFKKTLDLQPDNSEVWRSFGELLSRLPNRGAEAEEALRRTTQLSPRECVSWRSLGDYLLQAERFEEAAECFQRAIAINPRCNCSIPGYTAVLARQSSGLQSIAELIKGFIERMPENPYPHIALGQYLLSLGHDRQAATDQLLVALEKGVPPQVITRQFIDTIDLDDAPSASNQLGRYLAIITAKDLDRAAVGNLIAWALYQKGVSGNLLDFAIELARDSINRTPEQWAYRHTLACALLEANRYAESLTEVRWLADHVDESSLQEFVDLCIQIARSGQRLELLNAILESNSRQYYEPLVVALRLEGGDEPNVAREVLEVAQDIRRQIVDDKAAPVSAA
jgi:tetratricopeptide (TPR) repeat protein/energy-coupling factor transporter ATP-binding protein EcfA2